MSLDKPEKIRNILADNVIKFDKEVRRNGNANRFDDLQPGISKRKAHTFRTQNILRLKYNSNNAHQS
jgi:hypothetical protein